MKSVEKRLEEILERAKRDRKGDYRIYQYYKRQIEDLLLDSTEFEAAVRQLADVLMV